MGYLRLLKNEYIRVLAPFSFWQPW